VPETCPPDVVLVLGFLVEPLPESPPGSVPGSDTGQSPGPGPLLVEPGPLLSCGQLALPGPLLGPGPLLESLEPEPLLEPDPLLELDPLLPPWAAAGTATPPMTAMSSAVSIAMTSLNMLVNVNWRAIWHPSLDCLRSSPVWTPDRKVMYGRQAHVKTRVDTNGASSGREPAVCDLFVESAERHHRTGHGSGPTVDRLRPAGAA